MSWFVGLVVVCGVLSAVLHHFRKRYEVVDIVVLGGGHSDNPAHLDVRESIRARVQALGLGRASSLRNAKTGREFLNVWLYVPRAEKALTAVSKALAGQPVVVRALGPPVDMGVVAIGRRSLPLVWKGLLESWRATKRMSPR
jgi:hypothetical protein